MASRQLTKSSLEALNSYSSRLRRLTSPLPGARAISTYVASPSATVFSQTRTPYRVASGHCDAVSATFLERHFHSSSPRLSAATANSSQANPTEFTEMAWEGIVGALEAAQSNKQQVVESEHLMKALLEQKDGLARRIFTKAGVDNSSVLQATDDFISKQPKVTGGTSGPVLGSSFASMLADARKNKKEMGDDFVSVEHLVLAFHSVPWFGQQLLKNLQLGEKDLKDAIKAVRGSQRVTDQNPEGKDQALEKYGNDLTELAKRGKLDPVIGRDDEIRRCIQILSRRTKNNPVIID